MIQFTQKLMSQQFWSQIVWMNDRKESERLHALGTNVLFLRWLGARDENRAFLEGEQLADCVVPTHRNNNIRGVQVADQVVFELMKADIQILPDHLVESLTLGLGHFRTANNKTFDRVLRLHARQARDIGSDDLETVLSTSRCDENQLICFRQTQFSADFRSASRSGFMPQITAKPNLIRDRTWELVLLAGIKHFRYSQDEKEVIKCADRVVIPSHFPHGDCVFRTIENIAQDQCQIGVRLVAFQVIQSGDQFVLHACRFLIDQEKVGFVIYRSGQNQVGAKLNRLANFCAEVFYRVSFII